MDAVILARLQFAFTIGFHILWPTVTIGLASFIALLSGLWWRTGRTVYRDRHRKVIWRENAVGPTGLLSGSSDVREGARAGNCQSVHHYPPGTSKWNKIEHRLFCHITQNWRGRPLTSRMAVVELIGATTTKSGLKVESALDERIYVKGRKVSKAEMASLDITGDPFHPEWKYTIKPREPLEG